MCTNIFSKNFLNRITLQKVRSFVRRYRKFSNNNVYIFKKLWSSFGISFCEHFINLERLFLKKLPILINIGFGSGNFLYYSAVKNINFNFIGIEVHLPGIISCLKLLDKNKIFNIKLIFFDAIDIFTLMIRDNSIHIVQIFFPDPWKKKKHQKRRLIKSSFVTLLSKKILLHGIIHIKTDCILYAQHIKKVFLDNPSFILLDVTTVTDFYTIKNIKTNFENKGLKLGNNIFEYFFLKVSCI